MQLTDIQRKFVLHWGEMGSLWGVNRTVSQIHALLFAHGAPMVALKMSAEGCLIATPRERFRVPGHPVEAVDATGAWTSTQRLAPSAAYTVTAKIKKAPLEQINAIFDDWRGRGLVGSG